MAKIYGGTIIVALILVVIFVLGLITGVPLNR